MDADDELIVNLKVISKVQINTKLLHIWYLLEFRATELHTRKCSQMDTTR